MKRLVDLWADRPLREQVMIGALGILIVLLIDWYGLWLPMTHMAAAAEARVAQAASRLAEMDGEVSALSAKARNIGDLEAFVAQSAASARLNLVRRRKDGQNDLTVWISGAESRVFFAWAKVLGDSGIGVVNLMATSGEGGKMEIEAALSRPG
jgi:type II secretory pathway component PulM